MHWRALDLDGEVLLFDRDTGTNMLVSNAKTAHLRRSAPRMLQVALTNACDKSCEFCYRPLEARSRWSFDDIVELARFCEEWGVLELAFGGGEPTLFPRFGELLQTIWRETALCPSFTTHGKRLDAALLRQIRGSYGQLQVSVYDEDDTGAIIDVLVAERARFGLNYLVTPARARTLEADVAMFVARGVRDILFLSYKGRDPALHLSTRECAMFDESLSKLHRLLGQRVALKVDVCWAKRLVHTPQLLDADDCGANVDFLSLTSDKRVLACSFTDAGTPFDNVSEIRGIWQAMQAHREAAPSPGCARLPRFGLPVSHAFTVLQGTP
ncbi:MAG: radical SAM protein [Myxococcota bacterium]|nr:radical SAM protein [Deltaproteobacteria bacterium]MDQ3340897.1 radical SAM protein [Myxococcota bacterium]